MMIIYMDNTKTAPLPDPGKSVPQPPAANPFIVQNSSTQTDTPKKSGISLIMIVLSVITALIIGGIIGYMAFSPLNGAPKTNNIVVNQNSGEIVLPADAVQIQSCSDRRGKLYVKPTDIPVGPVYMVNEGKVIGIEYMLSKDEFLQGKSYKELAGQGVKVDHVNIGLLSEGHEGYEIPHFHVDMYTISYKQADAIVCPKNANPNPIASSSAKPATVSAETKAATSPAVVKP